MYMLYIYTYIYTYIYIYIYILYILYLHMYTSINQKVQTPDLHWCTNHLALRHMPRLPGEQLAGIDLQPLRNAKCFGEKNVELNSLDMVLNG